MPTRIRRGVQSGAGLLLLAVIGVQCQQSAESLAPRRSMAGEASYHAAAVAGVASTPVSTTLASVAPDVSLDALARTDPLAFVRRCRDEYVRRGIRDYTCRFVKQESVADRLGQVEEVSVRFREQPFSVDMQWIKNASSAKRALYVKDAWVDDHGRQLAWFKPKGALLQLFVPKIKQPITGRRAKKAARRSLDQFGFRSTLDLIIKYTERARQNDELILRYVGEGVIEGRATWVFERQLPYTGREEPYPDALLIYHIDQQWLVPTACYSYADPAGLELLGSYVITDVRFDVGLGDDDFDPDKLDF